MVLVATEWMFLLLLVLKEAVLVVRQDRVVGGGKGKREEWVIQFPRACYEGVRGGGRVEGGLS